MDFLSHNGKAVMAVPPLSGTRPEKRRRCFPVKSASRSRDINLIKSTKISAKDPEAPGMIGIPFWKRVLDITLVLAGMPLWIPLSLLVMLWIKAVSRGPVLFKQTRVGLGERKFTIFKFRSMKTGAASLLHEQHVKRLLQENAPAVKLDALGDPRMIPGGKFLRSTGLDELPQLLNILRGEMSFVGPRPCLLQEYYLFTESQRKRFHVLPGLTGLWQIKRKYPMTFKRMNVMDVFYTRKVSLLLDLSIIIKTPLALLKQVLEGLKSGNEKPETRSCSSSPVADSGHAKSS